MLIRKMELGVAQRAIVTHIVPMFSMPRRGAIPRRGLVTLGAGSLVRLVKTALQLGCVQVLVVQEDYNALHF